MAAIGEVKVRVVPVIDDLGEKLEQRIREIVREEIEKFSNGLMRGLRGVDATASGGSIQKMTDPYGKDFR